MFRASADRFGRCDMEHVPRFEHRDSRHNRKVTDLNPAEQLS